jgi:hypothetical protein
MSAEERIELFRGRYMSRGMTMTIAEGADLLREFEAHAAAAVERAVAAERESYAHWRQILLDDRTRADSRAEQAERERDEARADAAQVRCKFLNIERDLHSRLVHTESALAAERAARAAYQSLAEGLDKLCISYRMGSRPSGATLDKITKTREQLAALAPRAENPT